MGIKSTEELSLLKFFEEKPDEEIPERSLLLDLIVSIFLSKRNRAPDSNVAQVIITYLKSSKNVFIYLISHVSIGFRLH